MIKNKVYKKYTQYAEDVISGKIVAGYYLILSCHRYLSWFKRTDFYFDSDKIDNVINFISHLTLTTGKFHGKPFTLQPFQIFILSSIYGFYHKDDKTRVIRECYIQLARKSGKTAFAAAIALYEFIASGESQSEVVFAANSFPQADLAFSMVKDYLTFLDPKKKMFKTYRDTIKFPMTKSKMKVVSADASRLDGLNCAAAIQDEYHAATTSAVKDVLQDSMGMRVQPLMITITTAGFDLSGPCYQLRQTCIDILEEKSEDDSMFIAIYEPDINDDIEDVNTWRKAQPNLGVTVTEKYLRLQLKKAQNGVSLTEFKTKLLNIWVSSAIGEWIPKKYIDKCTHKWELSEMFGTQCIIGIDLAATSDLTAISILVVDEDSQKYYLKWKCYIPESALQESPNKEKYKQWRDMGILTITHGNVTDYQYIIDDIAEINKVVPVLNIAYDAWNSTFAIIKLTELGFECTPFSQSIGFQNKPTRFMELLVRSGRAVIDDNPIARWCYGNCVVREDQNENIKVQKINKSSEKKIDLVAASINALGNYLSEPQFDNVIIGTGNQILTRSDE